MSKYKTFKNTFYHVDKHYLTDEKSLSPKYYGMRIKSKKRKNKLKQLSTKNPTVKSGQKGKVCVFILV